MVRWKLNPDTRRVGFFSPSCLDARATTTRSWPSPKRMRLQQALLLMLLLALQGAMAVHEARHAAIMSTRGIQYKDPWISDDFVVGCIMIMFLLLFCFGKQ